MEESFGAQYALQIALQTLRERCQQFQQRIALLEDENITLRSNKSDLNREAGVSSLSEIDGLKLQVTELTEQKVQLTNNIQMISAENRNLWSRLSKLTQVNENLGSKLNKISDTLSQHNTAVSPSPHVALIRSKTFTQDEPHLKFVQKNVTDENDKISLELEDISLKLISSIAKEKSELELQCSQMTEMQNSDAVFINSFAFAYPTGKVECTVLDDFEEQLTILKTIKETLVKQKQELRKNLNNLELIKVQNKCTACKEPNNKTVSIAVQTTEKVEIEKSIAVDLESLAQWGTPENSNAFSGKIPNSTSKSIDDEKICPMCCKLFHNNSTFIDFQNHVESHFIAEGDGVNNLEALP